MKRLEALSLVTGAVLVGIAVALIDWRVALGLAGLLLIVSSFEFGRRSP